MNGNFKMLDVFDTFDTFYMHYIEFAKSESVNVDTGIRCRLQCPACARQLDSNIKKRIEGSNDISYRNFDMLLSTFDMLSLCGQISDPIYHPNFLDLLENKYNNYRHVRLGIHTNGSGKKMEWWNKAFEFSDSYTKWTFGLDGFTQETSNKYRVGTDAENVKQIMVLAAEKGIKVNWQYLVFEHNEHEVQRSIDFALKNNIVFSLTRPDRFGKDPNLKPSTKKEWVNQSGNVTVDALQFKPNHAGSSMVYSIKPDHAIRDKIVLKKND